MHVHPKAMIPNTIVFDMILSLWRTTAITASADRPDRIAVVTGRVVGMSAKAYRSYRLPNSSASFARSASFGGFRLFAITSSRPLAFRFAHRPNHPRQ